jgi:hypothetical protein
VNTVMKLLVLASRSYFYCTNMKAFWDVASLSLVEIDRRFRGAYCTHYQGARLYCNIYTIQQIQPHKLSARSEVLTAVRMTLFFLGVTLCGLMGRYRRFGETYCDISGFPGNATVEWCVIVVFPH